MDTPSPNSKDGAARVDSECKELAGSSRPSFAVPGPSGIKQCFKTVKAARRAVLLKPSPTSAASNTSIAIPGRSRPSSDAIKRYECCSCNKRFISLGKLSEHQFSHTGELPYSCQLCDKKFNSKSKLARHGLTHRTARAFACRVCGKSFHRKDHLSNHVRVHDPVRHLLVCERAGCGKHYSSALSFRKHSAIHAAEEGQLDCTICGTAFSDSSDLLQHLKMHTNTRTVKNDNEKKFPCGNCDRSFFTAKDVRRHQVVHTGRRDFACIYCPQKFGRKDHLVRHVKGAHSDRPWPPTTEISVQALVKTEDKPKPESLAFLGLKYLPSISVTYGNMIESSNTAIQSESTLKSGDTPLFEGVPIETIIKQEPITDIVATDTSNLDSKNFKLEIISPLTVDDLPDIICARTTQTSNKYDLDPNMIYVMSPTSPYVPLEVLEAPSVRSIEYLSTAEDSTAIEIEVSDSKQISVDPISDNLGLVQEEDVDSILNERAESVDRLTLPSQLMDLLKGSSLLAGSEQATVLPTFHQAFQNTAQSPKPPPSAPKNNERKRNFDADEEVTVLV